MKSILCFALFFVLESCHSSTKAYKNGDIIFQISLSAQSKAIQLATQSQYSHCGIIYQKGKEYFVFEAVQPVKLTPLKEWIARGKNQHYVIKRLKNAQSILTPKVLVSMQKEGEKFRGKKYDIYFGWDDQRIYCSELVWKIYKRGANIEIGKLQRLRDFDIDHKVVRKKLKERYGERIPLSEKVISPASIFEDSQLIEVERN
ncbi:YiiX family permuted papain-like enzyme [Cellulophaga sp. BC115SP]|uniref:YiiX family permuted papain-like enzyme n=1 Tax=Cellulophaga sp. BC115SP TaxID=2683263 RepID=UPI0014129D99|nr:YiiX family permuted papain-like enzyme [Cellulophaga sp. BC115SP]NBB29323.1 YiiX family permuted papain-like enzyme [Cellulophaga sp. BC115SP]